MLKGKLTTGGELLGRISGIMKVDPTLITKNITANGTYTAESDNADGYSEVDVDVQPTLITKNITANGTYTAESDNADGYSKVEVNVKHSIVTAAAPFGYYENATQYIYVDTYLEKGDTIVFTFACRNNITLPTGVELIFKSDDNWPIGVNQYLMFAKYTAIQNESHYFEFIQSSSNNRFWCTYAIFHDVTVIHSGRFLTYYRTDVPDRRSYDAPDKQVGEILFWGVSASAGPLSTSSVSLFNTIPDDIFRVSWPINNGDKYARLVSFLDNGNGATHRVFSGVDSSYCRNPCVIDAIEIIPN